MGNFWGSGGAWDQSQQPAAPPAQRWAGGAGSNPMTPVPKAGPIIIPAAGDTLGPAANQGLFPHDKGINIDPGTYATYEAYVADHPEMSKVGRAEWQAAHDSALTWTDANGVKHGPGGVAPGAAPGAGAGVGGAGAGSGLFAPRGDPGYALRPGQYGIDPNTALIPGYADSRNGLAASAAAAGNRAPSGPFRDNQLALGQALMNQANGQGPSLAQSQFQQATEANLAHAFALGQSLHGPSAGGQLRGIQNTQAGISQNAAMQSGQLRMQEQMAARAQLGNLLAQGRGGDQQQQAMNDSLVRFYTEQGLSLDVAQQRARMEMEQMRSNASLGFSTQNSSVDQANLDRILKILSGTAQGVTAGATSGGGGGGSIPSTGTTVTTSSQPVGYDASGTPIYSQPDEWTQYPGGG